MLGVAALGPAFGGGALAVAGGGAYSTTAAIGILARKLQGENVGKLPKIHQDIQTFLTPMSDDYRASDSDDSESVS